MQKGDLFDDLHRALNCDMISDMNNATYNRASRMALTSPYFTGYPLNAWNDMLQYLGLAQHAESEQQAKQLLLDSLGLPA